MGSEVLNEYRNILFFLKKIVRQRGLTYRDLAHKLDVSEVTIKRVFAGTYSQSHRVLQLCEVLGISYLWLVDQASQVTVEEYFLDEEQHALLESNLILLPVLLWLRDGKTQQEIAKRLSLSKADLYRFVRELETASLVSTRADGKVECVFKGQLRIDDESKLAACLQDAQNAAFFLCLRKKIRDPLVCLQAFNGSITETTHQKIAVKISEFGKELRSLAESDKRYAPGNSRRPIRWVFALGEFEFDWKTFQKL